MNKIATFVSFILLTVCFLSPLRAQVDTIVCDEDLRRQIFPQEIDTFLYVGQANQRIRLQAFSSSIGLQIDVFEPGGALLVSEQAPGGSLVEIPNLSLPQDGNYLIALTAGPGFLPSAYGFALQGLIDPACAQRVACTSDQIGGLQTNAKMEAFKLELESGDKLRVRAGFEGSTPDFEGRLDVYDPSGNLILTLAEKAPDLVELDSFLVTESGDWLFVLFAENGEGTSLYGISFQTLNKLGCGRSSNCGAEEIGGLLLNGKMEAFQIDFEAGDILRYRLKYAEQDFEGRLDIYNPQGNLIQSLAADQNGFLDLDGFLITQTGQWLFVLYDQSGFKSSLFKTSAQLLNDPACAVGLNCGTNLRQNIFWEAEMDAYNFSAEAGDRIDLVMAGEEGEMHEHLSIYAPDGSLLNAYTVQNDLDSILVNDLLLPLTGEYMIVAAESEGDNPTILFYNLSFNLQSRSIDSLLSSIMKDTVICQGESLLINVSYPGATYLWSDNSSDSTLYIDQAGTYGVNVSLNDCANTDTIKVEILPFDQIVLDTAICQGAQIMVGSSVHNSSGVYSDTIPASTGCRTIVTTQLSVYADTLDRTATICEGECILLAGVCRDTPGVYLDVFPTATGCDSIVRTTLSVLPVSRSEQETNIIPGDSIFLGGVWRKTAGFYQDTLLGGGANGCDSIILWDLSVRFVPIGAQVDTIACDGELSGVLVSGARDTFLYLGQADQLLRLRANFNVASENFRMQVYDQEGDLILEEQAATNGLVEIPSLFLTEDKDYVIILFNDLSSTITYGFSLQSLNDAACAYPMGCSSSSVDGRLLLRGEMDAFSLNLENGDKLRVRADWNSLSAFKGRLDVYDPNGNLTVAVSETSPGLLQLDSLLVDESGNWLFVFYEEDGSITGAYGIYFQVLNKTGCGSAIRCNDQRAGGVTPKGAMESYYINLNNNDRIRFRVKFEQPDFDGWLDVYNPEGHLTLSLPVDENGFLELENFLISQSGNWLFVLYSRSATQSSFNKVSLQLLNDPSCAIPISCADDRRAAIDWEAEMDAYTFSAQVGDRLDVKMVGEEAEMHEHLSLYDPAGNLLASYSVQNDTDSAIINNLLLPFSGEYMIVTAETEGDNAALLYYTLSFNLQTQAVTELLSNAMRDTDICPGENLLIDVYYPGATYLWSDNSRDSVLSISQPGIYSVTLGLNDCMTTDTMRVDLRPFNQMVLDTSVCQGAQIAVGTSLYTNTGIYVDTLPATTACGVIVTTQLTVLTDTLEQTAIICEGDCLFLAGACQDTPGVYLDVFPSSLGCDSIVRTRLSVFPKPMGEDERNICLGDSILLGGVWRNTPGLYPDTLRAAAINGCDSIINIRLTTLPQAKSEEELNICSGDSIFLAGIWRNTPGVYQDTLIGAAVNGCDSIVQTRLHILPNSMSEQATSICPGDSILLGGIWRDVPGVYLDTLTGAAVNGCDSVVLWQLQILPSFLSTSEMSICEGDSVFLGGSWRNTPGVYPDTLFNAAANGCDSTIIWQLAVQVAPEATISGDLQICTGESTSLRATAGLSSYRWSNGQTGSEIEASQAGTYTVAVENETGCTSTATVELQVSSGLEAEVIVSEEISCAEATDGMLEGRGSGGAPPYRWLWNTGALSQNIDNLAGGNYQLTLTDDFGCEAFAERNLTAPLPLSLSASVTPPLCPGGLGSISAIAQGAVEPFLYALDNQAFQASSQFGGKAAGNYLVRVQDVNGCEAETEVMIVDPPPLQLQILPADTAIFARDSFQAQIETDFLVDSLLWSPATGLSCNSCANPVVSPSQTQTYQLTTMSVEGCLQTAALQVNIDSRQRIFVPNAFSPNDDGINDRFTIFTGRKVLNIRSFLIFDRWGNLLFSQNNLTPRDSNFGWDGNVRGRPANIGVYVWLCEIEFSNGEKTNLKGEVSLIR